MFVVNATYPSIIRSSNSIVKASNSLDERIETIVSIVHASSELVGGSWSDIDGDTYFDVWAWVKNVGSSRIVGEDQMDVFVGKTGDLKRIPHANDAGGTYPQWTYSLENGTDWTRSVTLKITIHYESALSSDTYMIRVITPSGTYDEKYFSF